MIPGPLSYRDFRETGPWARGETCLLFGFIFYVNVKSGVGLKSINTKQNKILDLRNSSYSIKDLCIAFFGKGKFFTLPGITGHTVVF